MPTFEKKLCHYCISVMPIYQAIDKNNLDLKITYDSNIRQPGKTNNCTI